MHNFSTVSAMSCAPVSNSSVSDGVTRVESELMTKDDNLTRIYCEVL